MVSMRSPSMKVTIARSKTDFNGINEIIIANKEGRAIRFNESKVRPMGRGAAGVKSMTLGY
jgi:DNA gyrase/topoisomerase IV subunit A